MFFLENVAEQTYLSSLLTQMYSDISTIAWNIVLNIVENHYN